MGLIRIFILLAILLTQLWSKPAYCQQNNNCKPSVLALGERTKMQYLILGKINQKERLSCLNTTQIRGFPQLDCTFNDGNNIYHPDRFLGLTPERSYVVIDSAGRIIIDRADTIIAFSVGVASNTDWDIPCPDIDNRGAHRIFYQAIRNDSTTLYNNDGEKVIDRAFSGIISYDIFDFLRAKSKGYFITTDMNRELHGLIDSTGQEIIPVLYDFVRFQSPNADKNIFCYCNIERDSTNWSVLKSVCYMLDVESGEILLQSNGKIEINFPYGLYEVHSDGMVGVFHYKYGYLVKPKYERIEINGKEEDILILYKNGRPKRWKIPKSVIKNYTRLHPDD